MHLSTAERKILGRKASRRDANHECAHENILRDSGETESLWGESVAEPWQDEHSARFKLLNAPFYIYGVSYRDIVVATPLSSGNGYDFVRVDKHRGHSTYRVIAEPALFSGSDPWEKLQALGCTYESTCCEGQMLYTIDVPAQTNIYYAYRLLELGQQQGIWIFEEAHVGHALDQNQ